ncbi:hypothetical protein RCO28_27660 [Streptomyces sp. LHD-70]|uniref:hypothetical protein n=1 Tax=Streptomyces sp. LHD-70 TaxID=3072140 RepID=UPI00280F5BEC|nr:hypothetical protein [Streptomyces sp. LHD-70]MDQ8706218.1 hypothetical protein [Streptomyces sp. LHD-70]
MTKNKGPTPSQWAAADAAMSRVQHAWTGLRSIPSPDTAHALTRTLTDALGAVRALYEKPTVTSCKRHPRGSVDPAPAPGEGPCLACNMERRRALRGTQGIPGPRGEQS